MRVGEAGERPGLLAEAGAGLVVRDEPGGKHLEGDVAVELFVMGAVDLAHRACAERRDDTVVSERAPDHGRRTAPGRTAPGRWDKWREDATLHRPLPTTSSDLHDPLAADLLRGQRPEPGAADSSRIWRSALARSWPFAASSAFLSLGSTSSTFR